MTSSVSGTTYWTPRGDESFGFFLERPIAAQSVITPQPAKSGMQPYGSQHFSVRAQVPASYLQTPDEQYGRVHGMFPPPTIAAGAAPEVGWLSTQSLSSQHSAHVPVFGQQSDEPESRQSSFEQQSWQCPVSGQQSWPLLQLTSP
jgi:hypothetical protein